MKITHLRVHKLVSGPGYNNTAVDIEAALEPGEDPHNALTALSDKVSKEIQAIASKSYVEERRARVSWETKAAEEKIAVLRQEAEAVGKVLAKYTDLAAFAHKLGIDGAKELREAGHGDIPF